MKKSDLLMAGLIIALMMLFFPIPILKNFQQGFLFNDNLWWITSFIKFAVLATLGEMIGLRIKKRQYNQPGFGILPRAFVWGFLGIGIKMAFMIFSAGTPILLVKLFHIDQAINAMKFGNIFAANEAGLGFVRFITAFSISVFMNLIFAPIFMTFHKITDIHITQTGGTLKGFFSPIPIYKILSKLDWNVQWNFVFKRTIPFFWIPAHTITFLISPEYRIVFAALLGIILGIILSIAAQRSKSS
jgi:hypothetical protein